MHLACSTVFNHSFNKCVCVLHVKPIVSSFTMHLYWTHLCLWMTVEINYFLTVLETGNLVPTLDARPHPSNCILNHLTIWYILLHDSVEAPPPPKSLRPTVLLHSVPGSWSESEDTSINAPRGIAFLFLLTSDLQGTKFKTILERKGCNWRLQE
jgi:hypothetical protein